MHNVARPEQRRNARIERIRALRWEVGTGLPKEIDDCLSVAARQTPPQPQPALSLCRLPVLPVICLSFTEPCLCRHVLPLPQERDFFKGYSKLLGTYMSRPPNGVGLNLTLVRCRRLHPSLARRS